MAKPRWEVWVEPPEAEIFFVTDILNFEGN